MPSSRKIQPTRREFLTAITAAGLVAGSAPLTPEGVPLGDDARVVLQTGFEEGEPFPKLREHTVAADVSRNGQRSLVGEITEPNRACDLHIPFESAGRSMLHVAYWARSDNRSASAVWVRMGNDRRCFTRIEQVVKDKWQRIHASGVIETATTGVIEVVGPSSHSAPAGTMWIDDLSIILEPLQDLTWPDHPVDSPALACDESGEVWMAALERPDGGPLVRVCRLNGTKPESVAALKPERLTGTAAPAIAPFARGCVVAFPVEQDDRWRIAYAFVGKATGKCEFIDMPGTSNIAPALAVVGDRACVVWESNAGDARGIYASWVGRDGHSAPQRISRPEANGYNPDVVALPDGSLFAVWDTVRNESADIYGAWMRSGAWQTEQRITSDARIERHPALAVWRDQVWMAWQAQSYGERRINNVNEQRIAVARIDDGEVVAPMGTFEHVSTPKRLLMRPRIASDRSGRLWLTARQSAGQHSGWYPLAWHYDADGWSDPKLLMHQQGRWRPVPITVGPNGLVTACQFDDLTEAWAQRGIYPPWRSGIQVKVLAVEDDSAVVLATGPLRMPQTAFSLSEKITLCSAHLPRQRWRHDGQDLTLLWGDFHDHTDISVCARNMNPPGHDLFANERDIERLDFCTLTDHGYNFDPAQWALNGEQTRNNQDPGRFITFLGEEWTSSKNPPAIEGNPNRYGHHNLIFLDPYHRRFYDSFDGDISPAQLWKTLEGVEFICIPHQLADWKGKGKGNPPTDWTFTDDRLQPVAEIFQARQSYEYHGCPRQSPTGAPFAGYYLQDAWAQGIVIGVIASPDHGGGQGKAGVWAAELTREAIFEAVRARHTFGTSGAKMALRFSSGRTMMGDVVRRPAGAVSFHVKALAMHPIREAVIFRNNEIAHRVEPCTPEVEFEWADSAPPDEERLWYYVRLHAADDELAWSSPIWFTA